MSRSDLDANALEKRLRAIALPLQPFLNQPVRIAARLNFFPQDWLVQLIFLNRWAPDKIACPQALLRLPEGLHGEGITQADALYYLKQDVTALVKTIQDTEVSWKGWAASRVDAQLHVVGEYTMTPPGWTSLTPAPVIPYPIIPEHTVVRVVDWDRQGLHVQLPTGQVYHLTHGFFDKRYLADVPTPL